MMNEEENVIGHLLEVEKNAAMLVSDAQTEASKRVTAAKVSAEAEYKRQYTILASKIESEYKSSIEEISENNKKSLETFKQKIQNEKTDEKSFNSLLDSLLFSRTVTA